MVEASQIGIPQSVECEDQILVLLDANLRQSNEDGWLSKEESSRHWMPHHVDWSFKDVDSVFDDIDNTSV